MKPAVRIVMIHVGIVIGLFILTLIASRVLNVGTENTWLGGLFANAMGITICKMFYELSKTLENRGFSFSSPLLGFDKSFAILCMIIIISVLIIVNIIIVGNLVFDMGW